MGAGLIVIALILKALFFDMAELAHNGMAPTLLRGERVLIHKKGSPTLGSIAVCQHPSEEGWVVSRVAATEGMTIDSFGKELRIDGEPDVPAPTAEGAPPDQTEAPTAPFVGSTERDRFHIPACRWARQIREAHRISFETREAALEKVYAPCGSCKP